MRDLRPNRFLDMFTTGPAPKEEDMAHDEKCTCCGCTEERSRRLLNPYDPNVTVEQLRDEQHEIAVAAARTAERRAVARDAHMAALGGLATHEGQCDGLKWGSEDTVLMAESLALATVRRWDAFMAAVDAEGGE